MRRIGSFKWCKDDEDAMPMIHNKKMYADGPVDCSMGQEMQDMDMGMDEMHDMQDHEMHHMHDMQDMQDMQDHEMHHMHEKHHMHQGMQLAHSYVPWQNYNQAFSPREALMKGTLFPELWGVYPIPE